MIAIRSPPATCTRRRRKADGRLEREERFSEALSGLEEQLADLPSFTEVDRYLLSNNDIPAEALAKLDTGKAPRSSYLSSDASKIQVFVLFGLDGVDSSDSVMLVALDRVHQKIKLISLARDSYVFIPEFASFSKLAYSYTWGGAAMAVKNLNYNYYLNVSDYIAVDFEQLAQIIDRIGGVTVNIDEDEARYLFNYPNVHVGDCLLDGKTAVSYARIRKSSATDSDRERPAASVRSFSRSSTRCRTIAAVAVSGLCARLPRYVRNIVRG